MADMIEMINTFLADTSSKFLVSISGIGLTAVFARTSFFKTQKVLPHSKGSRPIIIMASKDHDAIIPDSHDKDIAAQKLISGEYEKHKIETKLWHPKFISPDIIDESDLILIGGPIANKTVKRMLELPHMEYTFGGQDGHAIINRRGETVCQPEYSEDREVSIDYGLISRLPNPYNPTYTVLIFSGCYGWGTFGAAHLYLKNDHVKKFIHAKKRKSPFFQTICSCEVDGASKSINHLLDLHPDPKMQKKIFVTLKTLGGK